MGQAVALVQSSPLLHSAHSLRAGSVTYAHLGPGQGDGRPRPFSVLTGLPVYFCDPHSPWQRGTNENTNGLPRQYLPRRTDLRSLTQDELDAIADELNGRPRQTLGFMSPSEVLEEALR